MVITYLIGNGFDLNQGLKTRYVDFYPYFKENASDTNRIKEWITPKSELWSDMEYAIGQSLDKVITQEDKEQFYKDKVEIDNLLGNYLREEEAKLELFSDNELVSEIKRSIGSLTSDSTDMGKSAIIRSLQQFSSRTNIRFNFVSFNYTDAQEKVFNIAKKSGIKISIPGDPRTTRTGVINRNFNVHGTIENGMIVGVNDKSQINNIELQKDDEFVRNIVKPYMNATLDNDNTNVVKRIISSSDILCIYGMSLGETDKLWWEEVVNWLRGSASRKLVIYNRVNPDEIHRNHPILVNAAKENVKRKLFASVEGIDMNTTEALKKQIIVLNNKSLFNFGKRRTDGE